jgi:S-adenosylmethionine/arginine decarboxylase-like enzyme
MPSKTKETRETRKTRKNKKTESKIQHHHLLLRMETKKCPLEEDKQKAKNLLEQIVHDIDMKLLGEARVFYVKYPRYNEGLTAMAPIQTSHIAFHFWRNPDPEIFQNAASQCLLEFDLYTCGTLSLQQIAKVLHHLTYFGPTHVNATVLNRNHSLVIDRQLIWDSTLNDTTYAQWLDKLAHK